MHVRITCVQLVRHLEYSRMFAVPMLYCMAALIGTVKRNTYFISYFNLHLNWWQLIQYSDNSAIIVLYLKAMTVNDNNCSTPTVECSQYITRLLRLIRMIMKRNQGKGYDEVDHVPRNPRNVFSFELTHKFVILLVKCSIQWCSSLGKVVQ